MEDARFCAHCGAVMTEFDGDLLLCNDCIFEVNADVNRVNVVNLTPHPIILMHKNGQTVTFPPSGEVARCEEISSPAGEISGMPIIHRTYGAVNGLPDSAPGTVYLVSAMVRSAMPKREDLLSPGDTIRDESGKIIGCKNFVQNKECI